MRISLKGLTAAQKEARVRELVDQVAADAERAFTQRVLATHDLSEADVERLALSYAELAVDREQTIREIGEWLRSEENARPS